MNASIWKRKNSTDLAGGDTIKKKPVARLRLDISDNVKKIRTEWISALKADRENADRITANDLTRNDQMVVRRKIKRFGTSDANINNDWQATRVGQKRKIIKTLRSEECK